MLGVHVARAVVGEKEGREVVAEESEFVSDLPKATFIFLAGLTRLAFVGVMSILG